METRGGISPIRTSASELRHFAESADGWRLWRCSPHASTPVSGRARNVRLEPLAKALPPVDPSLPFETLAAFTHLALERAFLADIPGGGGMEEARFESMLRRRLDTSTLPDQALAFCTAVVENVRALVSARQARQLARNVPFNVPIEADGVVHEVSGVIDLVLQTDTGWHVFEHCIQLFPLSELPRRVGLHEPQLASYAYALSLATSQPIVECALLAHGQGHCARLEDLDAAEQLRVLVGTLARALH